MIVDFGRKVQVKVEFYVSYEFCVKNWVKLFGGFEYNIVLWVTGTRVGQFTSGLCVLRWLYLFKIQHCTNIIIYNYNYIIIMFIIFLLPT